MNGFSDTVASLDAIIGVLKCPNFFVGMVLKLLLHSTKKTKQASAAKHKTKKWDTS